MSTGTATGTAVVAGVEVDTRHWIGGRRVSSARAFTDVSPIDEQPVAEVAAGGQAEVAAAVQAASAAFPGWAAAGPADRARVLHAIADGGAQLTPVSLELGGKSPLIVFADADLDLAVRHAVGQFDNAGQVCLAGTRLLVAEPVAAEFTERFLAAAAALRCGDPRDEATGLGPLITRAHLNRVDGFVRRAVAAGARPLTGGGPDRGLGGLYYQPTLLAGAAPGAEILTEEVFGPVLTLQTFAAEDEAVEMANATRYGLAATMFTGDERRAARVSARLVAGTVWVNCFFVRDLRAPFGGAGLSGIGREGGTWSFDFYADIKNTVYAPEGWRPNG
jgi:aminomuconate-semialdehyde/2-hydroxymuconate-6-semialdehyde dehydrogenase